MAFGEGAYAPALPYVGGGAEGAYESCPPAIPPALPMPPMDGAAGYVSCVYELGCCNVCW